MSNNFGTNNIWKSDLWKIHNIVQGSMLSFPKQVFISTLRDFFSHDTYYHYVKDSFGFSNTPDHTDLLPNAGINDNLTTRVFIGENYRQNIIYYPAILIKMNSMRYVPISASRDYGKINYQDILYTDGYNQTTISRPSSFVTSGIFEGSINIDIETKSLVSRDELSELVLMLFTEIAFDSLVNIGIIVKPGNISNTTESDDRTDKLFKQTITFDLRLEYERMIPIHDFIESIVFNIEFANLNSATPIVAPNLTISIEIDIDNYLINILESC